MRPAGRDAPPGGDFYDLFTVRNYLCAVIGDVAGRDIDTGRGPRHRDAAPPAAIALTPTKAVNNLTSRP